MALRDFADAELNDLKLMLQDWRQDRSPGKRRNSGEGDNLGDNASDLYVALPPVTGLPALQRFHGYTGTSPASGTGSNPEEGDIAGSAMCDIYRIDSDGALVFTGLTRRVYNLNDVAFAFDWMIVALLKQGKWVVVAGTVDC